MGRVLISAEALIAALALLMAAFLVVIVVRRRLIARDAELALCTLALPGDRTRTGMMRMTVDALEWYRLFGLVPRPHHRWPRRALDVQAPASTEDDVPAFGLMTSSVRVPVEVRGSDPLVIVMTVSDYTAFRAWVEAAPPSLPVSG